MNQFLRFGFVLRTLRNQYRLAVINERKKALRTKHQEQRSKFYLLLPPAPVDRPAIKVFGKPHDINLSQSKSRARR
jgi:hypothetical protein